MRPARVGTGDEFCVVDVETTGFSPRLGDRVVEVAAVRLRRDGRVLEEWSTLVNPARDVGATHVHGITAGDVIGAPTFAAVGGDLLELLDGAVVVAHNLRFDWGFLLAEYGRAGIVLPALPGLCTLALARTLDPLAMSHRLIDRCTDHGIAIAHIHQALADAKAAGELLTVYLGLVQPMGIEGLAALGCRPLEWPAQVPELPICGRCHERGADGARLDEQAGYLASLVRRLDGRSRAPGEVAAYLDLLDRVLDDRRIGEQEADALAATAREWGLSAAAADAAHHGYLRALCDAALADGVVTPVEHADLALVATLLNLTADDLSQALAAAQCAARAAPSGPPARPHGELRGLSVCFTGTLSTRHGGAPMTRAVAERLATEAGLRVAKSVTTGLDLLVVADPDTPSAKARRARSLGTRLMAEQVFWRSIGVESELGAGG